MLSPGITLGPYEIVNALGAGGMGEVYRARDARLDRDVAVKVLPAHLADDAAALARFEREARAIAALSHPNILAIFDVGRHDSTAYVVTELLEGETLGARLAAGPLPERKAADYGAQIAHGLAAAHDKGLVHRDLKPDNVFLGPDGRVKILDFGLAKQEQAALAGAATDEPTRVATTSPGIVLGTVAYMAPEQVRGQPVDHRADIFALGAILHEMLTGRRLFERETAAETMTAVLKDEASDLTAVQPAISPALARLVEHCLEKRPEERFQSARDLAFDLAAIAGRRTTASAPAADNAPRRLRSRALTAAAAIALLAVAVGLSYLSGRAPGGGATAPLPTFRQLTFRPQAILRAAFAPDGQTIVFSSVTEGASPSLFLLRSEYPEPTPLPLPPAHLLSISPQGELAILVNPTCKAWRDCRGTLAHVPLGGGGPRVLLDDVTDADWSPDGSELAVVHSMGNTDRLEYPIGKTLYESPGWLSNPRVSREGTRVALLEHPSRWDDRGWVIVIDANGGRMAVAGEFTSVEGLSWSPSGDEVLFSGAGRSGSIYGSFEVYAADREGNTRVVLSSAGGVSLQDVSGTGRWLVTSDDRAMGIRARPSGAQAERELSFLSGSWGPILSPDGRTLLFTEVSWTENGNYAACMRGTDGSPVVHLGPGLALDLSPDGKWALAATQNPVHMVLYPTGAGEKQTLDRGDLVAYRYARWFPDGTRILVCGTEQGKAARCYIQDPKGGAPRAVTPDGDGGVVSPDASRVAVFRPDNLPVIYRLDGSGSESLPSVNRDDRPLAWSADGHDVLLSSAGHVPGTIDRVDLRTGTRKTVLEFAPREPTGLVQAVARSVTPDGAGYAYEYFRIRSTLFLVEYGR